MYSPEQQLPCCRARQCRLLGSHVIYSESDLFSCRNGKHVPVALVDCASNMLLFVSRLLLFVCLCFNVKALSKHFLLNVGIYLCRSWIYILLRSGFHCISVLVPRGKQRKSDVISKQYVIFVYFLGGSHGAVTRRLNS